MILRYVKIWKATLDDNRTYIVVAKDIVGASQKAAEELAEQSGQHKLRKIEWEGDIAR